MSFEIDGPKIRAYLLPLFTYKQTSLEMKTFVTCVQPNQRFYRIESFDQIESMKYFQGFGTRT